MSYNDYRQHGSYIVAAFPVKPNRDTLRYALGGAQINTEVDTGNVDSLIKTGETKTKHHHDFKLTEINELTFFKIS